MTDDTADPAGDAEWRRAENRRSRPLASNRLDLKAPDAHSNDTVFEIYRSILEDGPLRWNPEANGRGFWSVCGYDAVAEVLKRPDMFSADRRVGGSRIFDTADVTAAPARTIFNLDPPARTEIRRALAPWFSAGAVEELRPLARERAGALVSELRASGGGDFARDVALPFLLLLASRLMGLPEDCCRRLNDWAGTLAGDDDPSLQPSLAHRRSAITGLDALATELFEGRMAPSTGLIAALRAAAPEGRPLDLNDFSVNLIVLFIAFTETTRHALGLMIDALDGFPAARARLLADPSLVPAAAREVIRWASPLVHTRRTAVTACTLAGVPIGKGDKLVVWLPAANRDPARWHAPHTFDVERFAATDATASLAFGAGPGFCLGWRHAEMLVETMLETLLREVPGTRPARPGRRLRSVLLRGYTSLPVVTDPQP